MNKSKFRDLDIENLQIHDVKEYTFKTPKSIIIGSPTYLKDTTLRDKHCFVLQKGIVGDDRLNRLELAEASLIDANGKYGDYLVASLTITDNYESPLYNDNKTSDLGLDMADKFLTKRANLKASEDVHLHIQFGDIGETLHSYGFEGDEWGYALRRMKGKHGSRWNIIMIRIFFHYDFYRSLDDIQPLFKHLLGGLEPLRGSV